MATLPILRVRDQVPAQGTDALAPPHGELLVGLVEALQRREEPGAAEPLGGRADQVEELREELRRPGDTAPIRVDELGLRAEAERGPAVLRVEAAVRGRTGL